MNELFAIEAMAQYLKDDVQARIAGAALAVFAARGFSSAAVAEIARAAGVSTGNVYRYYASKEVLFDAVVPPEIPARLARLLRQRVLALRGVTDVAALGPEAPYRVLSAELLDFCVAHRLAVVILLANAEGTRYAGFADATTRALERLAVAHFRELDRGASLDEPARFALHLVYGNLVRSMAAILSRYDDEAKLRAAVDAYGRFHLAGVRAFFA